MAARNRIVDIAVDDAVANGLKTQLSEDPIDLSYAGSAAVHVNRSVIEARRAAANSPPRSARKGVNIKKPGAVLAYDRGHSCSRRGRAAHDQGRRREDESAVGVKR